MAGLPSDYIKKNNFLRKSLFLLSALAICSTIVEARPVSGIGTKKERLRSHRVHAKNAIKKSQRRVRPKAHVGRTLKKARTASRLRAEKLRARAIATRQHVKSASAARLHTNNAAAVQSLPSKTAAKKQIARNEVARRHARTSAAQLQAQKGAQLNAQQKAVGVKRQALPQHLQQKEAKHQASALREQKREKQAAHLHERLKLERARQKAHLLEQVRARQEAHLRERLELERARQAALLLEQERVRQAAHHLEQERARQAALLRELLESNRRQEIEAQMEQMLDDNLIKQDLFHLTAGTNIPVPYQIADLGYQGRARTAQYALNLPAAPVFHPYHPTQPAQERGFKSPVFPLNIKLPGYHPELFPEALNRHLNGVNLSTVEAYLVGQDGPWNVNVSLKPQSWLDKDAPHLSPVPYNRRFIVDAGVFSNRINGPHLRGQPGGGLIENVPLSTHNTVQHGVVTEPTVVSSGDTLHVEGLNLDESQILYSLVKRKDVGDPVISTTVHIMLNAADQAVFNDILTGSRTLNEFGREFERRRRLPLGSPRRFSSERFEEELENLFS